MWLLGEGKLLGASPPKLTPSLFLHLLLTAISLFFLVRLISSQARKWRLYRKMPSVPTSTLLGSVLGHLEYFLQGSKNLDVTLFFTLLYTGITRIIRQKKEGFFYLRIGPFRHFIVVVSARAAEAILGSKNNDKNAEFDFFKDWLGDCLFTTNGSRWKEHRRLLTPAFHFEILNMFIPIMNGHLNTFKCIIESKMEPNGVALHEDIRPLVSNCVIDIFCASSMGVQMSAQTEWIARQKMSPGERAKSTKTPEGTYIDAMRGYLDMLLHRIIRPWLFPPALFRLSATGRQSDAYVRDLHTFTNAVVSQRRVEVEGSLSEEATLEECMDQLGRRKRLAFLDLLLVQHLKGGAHAFTLEDVQEEVDMFMSAGTDTTVTAIQFSLLLLGLNPDKQQLVHEELDLIFGDDTERDVTLEDINQMTYTEMAIKETMRLYPSGVFIGRMVTEEFDCDRYKVPTGTTVLLLLDMIHSDPEWFPQPELYLPERFSLEAASQRNPYAYIPFSSGTRTCLGRRYAMLQMKLFLASVLRKYTVRSLTQRDTILLNTFILTKALTPIQMQFTRRKGEAR